MKTASTTQTRPVTETAPRAQFVVPEVDIFETTDGYVLTAEMPGVAKDGAEITLEGTEMTITGRRQMNTVSGEAVSRESRGLDYRRVFELDPAIDSSKITAAVDQGVLTLTLPKSERLKPRKIKVD
jgi:HSP20 family protein